MLMNMKELLSVANEHNFAVPAFNIGSGQILNAVIDCCEKKQAPVILAIHPDELEFQGDSFVEMCKDRANKTKVPVAIHLDHGATMEQVLRAIRCGFTSVMIDASSESFEDNINITKEVIKVAHPLGVSVEAELGTIGDIKEDTGNREIGSKEIIYTKPEDAVKFVEETGCDTLAIAIGTAHGRYHGTPHIDFDLLKQITDVVDIPLVLHGGSGTGDENLRKAVKNGIQKVNLATELVVAGKEELETFIQDKNFDKWQLIPSFIKGYSDRLEHYVNLFDQENRAW